MKDERNGRLNPDDIIPEISGGKTIAVGLHEEKVRTLDDAMRELRRLELLEVELHAKGYTITYTEDEHGNPVGIELEPPFETSGE